MIKIRPRVVYNAVCSRNRVISSSVALLQIEKKKKKFEAETIGGIYRNFANDFHAISRGHDARPIANCPSNFSFSFLKPVTRLLSPPRERRKAIIEISSDSLFLHLRLSYRGYYTETEIWRTI